MPLKRALRKTRLRPNAASMPGVQTAKTSHRTMAAMIRISSDAIGRRATKELIGVTNTDAKGGLTALRHPTRCAPSGLALGIGPRRQADCLEGLGREAERLRHVRHGLH